MKKNLASRNHYGFRQGDSYDVFTGDGITCREEFLEFTKSVWTFPAEQAKVVGHPAPFPIELPYRLIQLYTYEREVVLDPFMGSGQAAIAAVKTKRHYVGYDINEEYVKLAERRIRRFTYVQSVPTLFDFIVKEDKEEFEAKR